MISASFPPSPGDAKAHHGSQRRQDTRASGTLSSSPTALPKIAAGRSTLSAKKLWKDHSNIDIYSAVEKGQRHASDEPLLPVSKNPKPLYRRTVADVKPFRILHSHSDVGIRNNTKSLPSLYAQMTFLANAVRNTDGTTSYKGMCKKRRQTVPSSAPGRLQATSPTDLHWASATNDRPVPRMLLPTSPGPNSNWYAWKSPREGESPSGSPRKERESRNHVTVVPAPRSDSGIDSRASFHHSIAQKRGKLVVPYKHNGRQLYSLINPPVEEHVRNQETAKTIDTSYGSSVITSSYATSYTDSSMSRERFSIKGIGHGIIRSPSAKDVKIISEVDGAQDTTQAKKFDGDHERESRSKLGLNSQEQDISTSQDSTVKDGGGSDRKVAKSKGVHFAEADDVVEDTSNQVCSDEKKAEGNQDNADVNPIRSDSQNSSDLNQDGSDLILVNSDLNQIGSDSNQVSSNSNQVSLDSNQNSSDLNQNETDLILGNSDLNQVSSDSNQVSSDSNQVSLDSNQNSSGLNQNETDLIRGNSDSNQVSSDSNQVDSDTNQVGSDSNFRTENTAVDDTAQDSNDASAAVNPTSDTNANTDSNLPSPSSLHSSDITSKTDDSPTPRKGFPQQTVKDTNNPDKDHSAIESPNSDGPSDNVEDG